MKHLILFCLFFSGMSAFSQNLLRQDMYYNNMNYINAAVGLADTSLKNDIQIYGIHKIVPENKWNNAPQMMINYIGQIDKIKGTINAGYSIDNHSFFNRHVIHAGYGAHLRKGNHYFDAGARINFNWDYIMDRSVVESQELHSISKIQFMPDLDLGFQYRINGWTLGIAAKNIFRNNVIQVYEVLANERVFYGNFGYHKQFGKVFKLGVFTLPSYNTSFQIDLGLDFSFWNRLSTTYILRVKELRHIYSIKGTITKNIYLGASLSNSHVSTDMNLNALIGVRF